MQFHAKYVPAIETSYKENVDNKRKILGFSYVMRTVFAVFFFFVHTVIFIYYCNKKTVI